MEQSIKCIYEEGYLKPLEKVNLKEHSEVDVLIKKQNRGLEKELKEGYEEMAEESARVTEEWKHTEKDLEVSG